MRVDLFDFELPEALIALRPARPRDSARLLHVHCDGSLADRVVREAPAWFEAGDLLVFNDTRVIPARLKGVRMRAQSIVAVEATLHQRLSSSRWAAFAKPGKRLQPGDRIRFGGAGGSEVCLTGTLDARVEAKGDSGEIILAFDLAGADLDSAIALHGEMPLPPTSPGAAPKTIPIGPIIKPSSPHEMALWPRPRRVCTSPKNCSPRLTQEGWSAALSRSMSAPEHFCR